MENKNITAAIFFGISFYVICNTIVYSFSFGDFKSKCLADGGVYSNTVSSISVVSRTCTYSKNK